MNPCKKVVSPAQLLLSGEVKGQYEIGYLHAVNEIGFRLHGIAHFEPMKDGFLGIPWVGPCDEKIGLSVSNQLQSLMRQGDGPGLAKLLRNLREHKPIGNATVVSVVIAECLFDFVGFVPQVNDGVPP